MATAPTKARAIVRALIDPATGGISGAAKLVGSHYAYAHRVTNDPKWAAGPLDAIDRARIRMSTDPAHVLAERYDVTVAYIVSLRIGVEWDDLLDYTSNQGKPSARSLFYGIQRGPNDIGGDKRHAY